MSKNQKKKAETTDQPEHLIETSKNCENELVQLNLQIQSLQEQNKRIQADFQNARRRMAEEKTTFLKFANQELMEQLLQPLEHLCLASEQLHDQGLSMVVLQLKKTLEENGLTEINVLGLPFDVTTMEAVEKGPLGQEVVQVVKRGYRLHDKVIQHAKVILD